MTKTLSRLTKKDKQEITDRSVDRAMSEYFGGVTKTEAEQVFDALGLMSTFPGNTLPEPLVDCDVIWRSEMRVGDTLATQRFSVQVKYQQLLFKYFHSGDGQPIRAIELPDSSHISFDNWDLHADRVAKRAIAKLKF